MRRGKVFTGRDERPMMRRGKVFTSRGGEAYDEERKGLHWKRREANDEEEGLHWKRKEAYDEEGRSSLEGTRGQ